MQGKVISANARPKWVLPMALIAVLFGVATVLSGGRSLFTESGRIDAGDYVPFVLWFNFLAGFAYIVAGIGLAQERAWFKNLAFVIAAATSLVFVLFGIHIWLGGAFENRTVMAMVLRTGFWLTMARLAHALR